MKKKHFFLAAVLAAGLVFSACTGAASQQPPVYSNLSEESIRYDLDSLLSTAGVPDSQRHVFFQHVDQFNAVMKPQELTQGFTPVGTEKYDPYQVQDAWMEAYPDFLGYNCRITAFSLYGDGFMTVPSDPKTTDPTMLEFDLGALQEDDSAFPGREQQFRTFFEAVPTDATKDVSVHAEKMLQAWQQRGISFREDPRIRMINVVFHMQEEDSNLLYIGHSGILLPTPDGDLWFVEKLAFQEPYQVVKLQNRRQLQSYLMEKYDLDENQPVAKPFILENDSLMRT